MNERERFEKWFSGFDSRRMSSKMMMESAWQAALSTRKPCGFGIVDKDGYTTTLTINSENKARVWASELNKDSSNHRFRVVPLFYEDQS